MDYTPWTTNMPKFEYRKDKSFFELVVPTKDTVRFSWLLRMQILNGNPVFLTGITGVGKSIIASSTLEEMKKNLNYDTIMLSFSS
jgi:dynein heavy chain